MRRYINFLIYEIKFTRTNLLFHIFAMVFPILYLLIFSYLMSSDITLPVKIETPHTEEEKQLFQIMEEIESPYGLHYWDVEKSARDNSFIQYPAKIKDGKDNKTNFNFILNYHLTNTNLIKNFRNRAVRGILKMVEEEKLGGRAVIVEEKPLYKHDISWIGFMGMTIMLMGMVISGIFIGGTSLASQIEQHTLGQYILSPLSDMTIIVIKLLAITLKTIIITLVYIIVFYIITGIAPLHALQMLILVSIFSFLITAIGMIIGTVTGSTLLTFITGLIFSLGSWIAGGGFGTTSFYPGIINILNYFNPGYYAIKLNKGIFFQTDFSLYTPDFYSLLSITVFAVSFLGFVYRSAYKWGVE